MQEEFAHHYALTEDELKRMSERAVIAFDASFLLDLYRYSPETTSQMFMVLEGLANQVWLPHQAAAEFHKNRLNVVAQLRSKHESVLKRVKEDGERLVKSIESDCAKHPHLNAASITSALSQALRNVQQEITSVEEKHQAITTSLKEDPIWGRLTKIFRNKVGPSYSDEDLRKHEQTAKGRFEERTPPGYMDAKKEYPYGDYILWRQLLDHCKDTGRPAFFVTSDVKEDWWLEYAGTKLGPLPALRQEFRKEVAQEFHLYETRHFVQVFAPRFNVKPKKAVEEIERVNKVAKDRAKRDRESSWRDGTIDLSAWHLRHPPLIEQRRAELDRMMQDYRLRDSLAHGLGDSATTALRDHLEELNDQQSRLSHLALLSDREREFDLLRARRDEELQRIQFREEQLRDLLRRDAIAARENNLFPDSDTEG